MKFFLIAVLSVSLLCTCGPAQDKPGGPGEANDVLAAERIFNVAYESLDAAVLERLLDEDFTLSYANQDTRKDKARWLGELGQLRAVFPQLEISTDSLEVTDTASGKIVSGIRTFSWSTASEQGSYQERFINRWQPGEQGFRLAEMELQ